MKSFLRYFFGLVIVLFGVPLLTQELLNLTKGIIFRPYTSNAVQQLPPIPDVPKENLAAFVQTQDRVPMQSLREPRAVVDHRGWIDIWELKRDVSQVESMPRGNSDSCIYEEGEAEGSGNETKVTSEETKQREESAAKAVEACYAENERIEAEFQRAYSAFNTAWLPALIDATKKGDPVAEVMLRTCDTSYAINREGIETDCSAGDKQEIARQRLETIGFAPALSALNNSDLYKMLSSKPVRSWKGQGPYSDDPVVAMLERSIDAIEKGDLSAGENTGGYRCYKGQDIGDEAYLRCNYLYHMANALKTKARWFFIAGGLYSNESANIERLSLYRIRNTNEPFRSVGDDVYPAELHNRYIKNVAAFLTELDKRSRIMEANIAAYLRKDARWAAFLMERNGSSLRFALPPTSKADAT